MILRFLDVSHRLRWLEKKSRQVIQGLGFSKTSWLWSEYVWNVTLFWLEIECAPRTAKLRQHSPKIRGGGRFLRFVEPLWPYKWLEVSKCAKQVNCKFQELQFWSCTFFKTLNRIYNFFEKIMFERCLSVTRLLEKSYLYWRYFFFNSLSWKVELPSQYVQDISSHWENVFHFYYNFINVLSPAVFQKRLVVPKRTWKYYAVFGPIF